MRRILIAVALCCVGGVTAWANPAGPYPAFTTGNKLFSECEGFRTQGTVSPDEIVRFTYCKAYVVGVADALAMFKAHLEGGSFWSGLKAYGQMQPAVQPNEKFQGQFRRLNLPAHLDEPFPATVALHLGTPSPFVLLRLVSGPNLSSLQEVRG